MNIATLRFNGTDEGLEYASRMLNLDVASTWSAGDIRRGGKVHERSGRYFELTDAATPAELVATIRELLYSWHAKNLSLPALGVDGELSIGITVGDSIQFIGFLDFSVADLIMLGAIGINLSIAAYPTSDEVNEPQ